MIFNKHPKLRLRDLTISDMKKYAVGVLKDVSGGGSFRRNVSGDPDGLSRIVDLILEKAEGVFLWVHLALKSCKTGVQNRDDWS